MKKIKLKTKEELITFIVEMALRKHTFSYKNIDTSEITDFSYIFPEALKIISQKGSFFLGFPDIDNLTYLDVSNGINFEGMFAGIRYGIPYIKSLNWDTRKVENCNFMFAGSDLPDYKFLENFKFENLKTAIAMFENCENFNIDVSNWDLSKLEVADGMFLNCIHFRGKGLNNLKFKSLQSANDMFSNTPIKDINLVISSNLKSANRMFKNCDQFNGDVSNIDTKNLKEAVSMFEDCYNFEGKGLEKWDVSNLEIADKMFYLESENESKFNPKDLSNWMPKKLRSARSMFENCSSFKGKGLEKWVVPNLYSGEQITDIFKQTQVPVHKIKWSHIFYHTRSKEYVQSEYDELVLKFLPKDAIKESLKNVDYSDTRSFFTSMAPSLEAIFLAREKARKEFIRMRGFDPYTTV